MTTSSRSFDRRKVNSITDRITDRERDAFKRKADALIRQASRSGGERSRIMQIALHAASQLYERDNPEFIYAMTQMRRIPVSIGEFMDSEDFLGGVEYDIWPALKHDVFKMNPDVLIGEEPVHEVFLGGATGTGKTHTASATIMYQVYLLTCFERPQALYGLTPQTPIVFFLQSVSASVTKRVIYQPMRQAITTMRYFQRFVPYNKYVDSELQLDGGIKVIPALASLQSILGQAVCGALLDEVNFMQIIENSKKVPGLAGMGGKFDQAREIYSNISRRRKRSFTTRGVSIGCICVASSTRYKDDFLDSRIDEAIKNNERNIQIFRHSQFEVNPRFAEGKYPKFRVAVGNEEQGTTVIEDHMQPGIHYPASAQIIEVPDPYLADFRRDPDAALRDVVGIATSAISPFIRRRQKINDALFRGKERNLPALIEKDSVILAEDGMPTFNTDVLRNLSASTRAKSRWIHVDLSRVEDRCGIGMVRLDGFVSVPVKDGRDHSDPDGADGPLLMETLPKLTVEMAVGIKPSPAREIDIAEVRGWIMRFASEWGLNIEGVSFDGFDSRETIQALNRSGIRAKNVSVDTTTVPYEMVRDALYEDRMDIQPDCTLLQHELSTVEYYATKNKVDHPPKGTKDVADGVAGAVYAAMKSRIVRTKPAFLTGEWGTQDGEGVAPDTDPRFRVRRQRVRLATTPRRR